VFTYFVHLRLVDIFSHFTGAHTQHLNCTLSQLTRQPDALGNSIWMQQVNTFSLTSTP